VQLETWGEFILVSRCVAEMLTECILRTLQTAIDPTVGTGVPVYHMQDSRLWVSLVGGTVYKRHNCRWNDLPDLWLVRIARLFSEQPCALTPIYSLDTICVAGDV
jgi:hypothetical protein